MSDESRDLKKSSDSGTIAYFILRGLDYLNFYEKFS